MTKITISLAYVQSATTQDYQETQVVQGTNIYQALQLSGWLDKYPEIDDWCEQIKSGEHTKEQGLSTAPTPRRWMVGVYSEKKPLDYRLKDKDRIEIYRPLTTDPMSKRKNRAIK